jgi:hypothetical protein
MRDFDLSLPGSELFFRALTVLLQKQAALVLFDHEEVCHGVVNESTKRGR